VAALDVLRALAREPAGLEAFLEECSRAAGGDPRLDRHLTGLRDEVPSLFAGQNPQFGARRLVEHLALALQGSLLVRHAPAAVADAFCATRLGREGGLVYGTLPPQADARAIVDRALPV